MQGQCVRCPALPAPVIVEQAATVDVDQVQARFSAGEYGAVDDMPRCIGQRRGQHQMIGARKQLMDVLRCFDAFNLERRLTLT